MSELPFFCAFPDSDSKATAHPAVERIQRESGVRVLRHASGRPMLIGRWTDAEFRTAEAGPVRLAVLGAFDADVARLTEIAGRVRDAADVTAAFRTWPGSFHVVASIGGDLVVRGTAYGSRRVFHTLLAGTVVAADRAATLAGLSGAQVDVQALALRLVNPLPAPLSERMMWHGVHQVPPGSYLVAPAGGGTRQARWHRPPESVLDIADGAPALRDALAAAVGVRTAGGGLVSADLSGGLDSTSICFLSRQNANGSMLVAGTATTDESINDDGRWARLAVSGMSAVEHVELRGGELPLFYQGVLDDRDRWDFPSALAVSRDRALRMAKKMAGRGSRVHLTGYGGDHLFLGAANHFHALVTRRPLRTLQRLRGYRTLYGWSWRPVLAQLADRRSFRGSLAAIDVRDPGGVDISVPRLGWVCRPQVPDWLTPGCLDLVQEGMSAAARTAEPLGATPGRHNELAMIYSGTQEMRAMDDAARLCGIPVAHPYFDDHVIDAALAVRVEDRVTPWRYKPLLVEAMRGVVPDRSLRRITKGEGTPDAEGGLLRHRAELAGLWEDSALGRLGLVDAAALRTVCGSPNSPGLRNNGVNTTLSCESWLRSTSRQPAGTFC